MDELTALALAARLREPGAFEEFVAGTYGQVRRFCMTLVDADAADDLAQETFARCARAIRQFRGEAPARTWLLSIARHVCMDELRSRARHRQGNTARYWPGHIRVEPDAAEHVSVADLLARLEPDRRAAFVLTQMLRLSYLEASQVCGCPVGTIRSRVARARGDLIEMLAEPGSVASGPRERWTGRDSRPG